MFLVREPARLGNRLDSIGCFLEPAPRRVDTDCFYGLRRSAAARLRIEPGEVPGAHVHTFRKRLDSKVILQMLRDPLLQLGEPVRIRLRLRGKQGAVLGLAARAL